MKKTLLFIIAATLSLLFPHDLSAAGTVSFVPKSRLATGHWVKIGVGESGIYEISYTKLREMGFSDPSRVGVLGRGGREMQLNFTDLQGNRLNPDDLSPIAVYHHNDRIYFYGEGVNTIGFTPSDTYSTKGIFERISKNVYTDTGYYFLSDTPGSRIDMEVETRPKSGKLGSEGLCYLHHETDLEQNNSHTGNLFWGEKFNEGEPSRREWEFSLPDAVIGEEAVMECFFYVQNGTEGLLSWGVEGAKGNNNSKIVTYNSNFFRPQEPTVNSTSLPNTKGKVYINYTNLDNPSGIANLDYWTLTYKSKIPTLKDGTGNAIGQHFIAIPDIPSGATVSLDMAATPEATLFDISNPLFPVAVPVTRSGNTSYATLSSKLQYIPVIVSDLSRAQMQIKGYSTGWENVANQDLHSLGAKGASLLIITTEELLPQAERLAEVHRNHDGIRVVVATAEQVYNEFSAGVPDPMAYRTLAKMLYQSPGEKLKNVLLLGPLFSDFRGMLTSTRQNRGLIAFQNPIVLLENGAQNVNDFIGMMDDIINTERLEKARVHVGVGVLPCISSMEADAYIDKVESYLSDETFAYRLNKMMTVGGLGDRHIHENQAIALGKYLNPNNFNHLMYTTLAIDAYGSKEAGKKFIGAFSEGYNLITYFGHGGPMMLGKNMDFFCKADVSKLHNKAYPFMVFAGCILSNTDRGIRGLSEEMVLGHDAGIIGALAATRDTWSGENMDLVKLFYNRLFKDGNSIASPQHTSPITVGEVYARAKDQSEYSNELSYLLLCDPAIRIPIAVRTVDTDSYAEKIYPGRTLTFSGNIVDFDGNKDRSFNGEIVARLALPEIIIESEDLDTDSRSDGDILKVPYYDRQVSAASATVKNGEFTIQIHVPGSMSEEIGKNAYLYLSAFDKNTRLGGAATCRPLICNPPTSEISRPDNTAPVIAEMEYDRESESLFITVSDNMALDTSYEGQPASFRLYIDGKYSREGWEALTIYTPDEIGYSKIIPVGYLATGHHKARLELSDLEGNKAIKEIDFTIGRLSTLTLELAGEAAYEEAVFNIEGSTGSPLSLIITTEDGKAVANIPVRRENVRWDLKDASGRRVSSGLYKAHLSQNDGKGFSEAILIPVVGRN